MGSILAFAAWVVLAALAVYCLWHGGRALLTGTVDSPTALSPGLTKRSEAPFSYWVQVGFWLVGAAVIGYKLVSWALNAIEA
jgi:hypothetical protein